MIEIHTFEGADPRLDDALRVRHVVFVLGQDVPADLKVDGLDPTCRHFLALLDGRVVGAARLRITDEGEAKAERVAVLDEARGRGVGRRLMAAVEAAAAAGHPRLILSAQDHAIAFYEELGYEGDGEDFWEAGILHRHMHKRLG